VGLVVLAAGMEGRWPERGCGIVIGGGGKADRCVGASGVLKVGAGRTGVAGVLTGGTEEDGSCGNRDVAGAIFISCRVCSTGGMRETSGTGVG